jgi:hypothetical protein
LPFFSDFPSALPRMDSELEMKLVNASTAT